MSQLGQSPPTTFEFFGVPRTMEAAHARDLHRALGLLLDSQALAANTTGDSAWASWFDPLARGARLRQALDALPRTEDLLLGRSRELLTEPLTLEVGEGKMLATPEGHAVYQLLAAKLESNTGEPVRIRSTDSEGVQDVVLSFYRDRSMARLRSVVDLRAGDAPPLLPQAAGLVLLLILNGNFGNEHALARPSRPEDRSVVDASVAAIVSAFAETLSPSKKGRAPGAYSLYGGYAMTEARRRLGSDLTTNPAYLAAGSRERVIERVSAELRRRTPSPTEVQLEKAIVALVDAYIRHRGELAGYGLAQGTPSDGGRLAREVLSSYRPGSA